MIGDGARVAHNMEAVDWPDAKGVYIDTHRTDTNMCQHAGTPLVRIGEWWASFVSVRVVLI